MKRRYVAPKIVALVCLALGLPSLPAAQERMGGEAFDALTRGQTFYYGNGPEPYGAEEYLDGHRVRWSFLDGECKEGFWYETDESLICFIYEDRPNDPQCWAFFQRGGRLVASFENGGSSAELYQIDKSEKPMLCHGPQIGV